MATISVSTFDTVEIKEDQKTEFKRSIFIDPETQMPGAKQMRTIAETIAAFMNADGGMLPDAVRRRGQSAGQEVAGEQGVLVESGHGSQEDH